MRNAISITAIAVLAGLVLPTTAEAAITNGGFEDDFTGWEAIGDYRVENSKFGSDPIEGNSQAFLSTAFNEIVGIDDNGYEIIGGNAGSVSFISGFAEDYSLEGFFSSSTFFGDDLLGGLATAEPIEGSAIKQKFTASAGETLSFSWNFLTNESTSKAAVDDFTYPDFNDFAFALIQSGSSIEWFRLADTIEDFNNSSTSFADETGFRTFSYTVPTTDKYTLGIGVVDVGDSKRISGLLVDKVEAVPEPNSTLGTLAMLFLGAGWTVAVQKRKQQKIH